jgi:hypothetical protein
VAWSVYDGPDAPLPDSPYGANNFMTRKTILAVGAAGQFAGLAVTALSGLGARVRGFVRDAQQGNEAQRLGAAEVVIGDLRDLRSVDAALAGVDAVFYIAPAFLPDEAEVGKRFVDAVVRSGARRIVFSSVIHPVLAELVNHAAKAPVEAAILDSGLEYALLHPALYFQNYARAPKGRAWQAVRSMKSSLDRRVVRGDVPREKRDDWRSLRPTGARRRYRLMASSGLQRSCAWSSDPSSASRPVFMREGGKEPLRASRQRMEPCHACSHDPLRHSAVD